MRGVVVQEMELLVTHHLLDDYVTNHLHNYRRNPATQLS